MSQEFTSTKDFSVGDLFLNRQGEVYCYIVNIVQYKKGSQYEYQLCYFNQVRAESNFVGLLNRLCGIFPKSRSLHGYLTMVFLQMHFLHRSGCLLLE